MLSYLTQSWLYLVSALGFLERLLSYMISLIDHYCRACRVSSVQIGLASEWSLVKLGILMGADTCKECIRKCLFLLYLFLNRSLSLLSLSCGNWSAFARHFDDVGSIICDKITLINAGRWSLLWVSERLFFGLFSYLRCVCVAFWFLQLVFIDFFLKIAQREL